MFASSSDYLQAEFKRLDLLLHREILRLRASYQLSLDEFRGLYISDEQVDGLVNQLAAQDPAVADLSVEALTFQAAALHEQNQARLPPDCPWARLVERFRLTPLEQDLLLLAAAPELERKYEVLYAYLNNDVTRKQATGDLAVRLFCETPAGSTQLRAALLPGAALYDSGLLELNPASPDRLARLSAGFTIAPAATHFWLGLPPIDARSAGWSWLEPCQPAVDWPALDPDLRARLERLPALFNSRPGPLLVFEGPPGAGRLAAARALCSRMHLPLLRVDLAAAIASGADQAWAARTAALQARMGGCALYLDQAEQLFSPEGGPPARPGGERAWLEHLLPLDGPIFLALAPGTLWNVQMRGARAAAFSFGPPEFETRRRLWSEAAAAHGQWLPETALAALADRFVLTPRQIQAALQSALDLAALDGADDLPFETLLEGARLQAGSSLGRLAVKVNLLHSWEDLVLPPVTLQQVREVADAARNTHIVYYRWQFGQRFNEGRGLKVMFSGASGTGKTMTAGVIARDLGLDLYKIDLSGVVSKYIGETEKNLDRIFEAALAANAILFFDEADALFGRRSEVKDAHDRYANIEVSYLLQKMETHAGTIILATNLGKNIDEAFSRRMQYVVEFPLPDTAHRVRLWRGMFPPAAPLGKEVDFHFLARQFQISGGEIRNAALEAAFLAARDGQVIRMDHLMQAMARLMYKQGRLPSPLEFGEYYERVLS